MTWDQRELCPDGACVGVIGPEGTCKVCGRAAANWGDERNRGLTPLPPEGPSETADDSPDDLDDEYEADDDADDAADDDPDEAPALGAEPWAERKLCPDDACIGLLGDDQRCKVCGKSPASP